MSVVKINVIEVPEGRGAMLEERFAARAGEVETVDGFESFELLRPTDGTDRYLVVTRWRDEGAFTAWMSSSSFAASHGERPVSAHPGAESHADTAGSGATASSPGAGSAADVPVDHDEFGHPGADSTPGGEGSGPDEGHPGDDSRGPAATGSELWSFDVVIEAKRA